MMACLLWQSKKMDANGKKKNKQKNPNRAEQITHSVTGRPLEESHTQSAEPISAFASGLVTARKAAHNPHGLAAADASLLLVPSFLLNVVHTHITIKRPPLRCTTVAHIRTSTHTHSTPRDPRSGAVPDLWALRTALLRTTPHKWHARACEASRTGKCVTRRETHPGCVIHFL